MFLKNFLCTLKILKIINVNFNIKFKKTLEDDINTASAITVLYDVLKSDINNYTKIKLIEEFDKVLSLDLLKEDSVVVPKEILNLIEKRKEL